MSAITRAAQALPPPPPQPSCKDATRSTFDVHKVLESWSKKPELCRDDTNPISTKELILILAESKSDARFPLHAGALSFLFETLNGLLSDPDDLEKLALDDILKAMVVVYDHHEETYEAATALKKIFLLKLNEFSLSQQVTAFELICAYPDEEDLETPAFKDALIKTISSLIMGPEFATKREPISVFIAYIGQAHLSTLATFMAPLGISAFQRVCELKQESLCIEIIKCGLDLKKTTTKKNTALHIASTYQLEGVVQHLLPLCPNDVNKPNRDGNTPLHLSCSACNIPITLLLLSHKADPSKRNQLVFTPFQLPSIKLALPNEAEKLAAIQFYCHFFQGFDAVITHLQQVNCDSLFGFLSTRLDALCFKEAPDVNPLEVAYISSIPNFAEYICKTLSDEQCTKYAEALIKKYPQAKDATLTLLYWNACQKGQQQKAVSYIDELNVDALNKHTFLLTAFTYKLQLVVRALCQKGVDVSISDIKGATPLHLCCKKGYADTAELLLKHKACLTRKDHKGQTPFQKMLTSDLWKNNPDKMKGFVTRFFCHFPNLRERIETHQNTNFSEYFARYPEFLIDQPFVTKEANPLFIPLVFNDLQIARALFIKLGQKRYQEHLDALKATYTTSDFDELEFAGYATNRDHLKQQVPEAIPDKPEKADLDEMLAFFDEVNFYDDKKTPYFDPEAYGLKAEPHKTYATILKEGFLQVVREQKLTMPPPIKEERDQLYKDVTNALCLATRAVKTADDKASLLSRCTKLIGVCSGGVLPVCLNLYNEFVNGIPPTFEAALYEKLGELRRLVLETLLPQGNNSHHFLMLFYQLSKKEELNLPYAKAAYDDRVAAPNAVDVDSTKARFFEKYTPALIVPYIEKQIVHNGEFRERYIDHWKKKQPDAWRTLVYEDVNTAKLNRHLVTQTLTELQIISA